jgi:hypothetical protein
VDPGVEPVRVAQTRQVAPGADESLLDRVARELRVAEDQAGCRVQPREVHVDERGEGVMLASPRSFDQASLVHGRPCFGTAKSRLHYALAAMRATVTGEPEPGPAVAGGQLA